MGAFSLNTLDREKYFEEFEDKILHDYENWIMQTRFKVGQGVKNEMELEHNLLFHRILCTDNCEIIDYVKDKLNGKLEDCGKKIKNKSLRELTKALAEYSECEDECCLINEACPVLEGSW